MVAGLGVDLFEVSRMADRIRASGPDFADRIFTPAELARCGRQRRSEACLAACFAAKEAVFKALALDDRRGWDWRDVEIVSGSRIAHDVVLHNDLKLAAEQLGIARIHVSTCCTRRLALASAILER